MQGSGKGEGLGGEGGRRNGMGDLQCEHCEDVCRSVLWNERKREIRLIFNHCGKMQTRVF